MGTRPRTVVTDFRGAFKPYRSCTTCCVRSEPGAYLYIVSFFSGRLTRTFFMWFRTIRFPLPRKMCVSYTIPTQILRSAGERLSPLHPPPPHRSSSTPLIRSQTLREHTIVFTTRTSVRRTVAFRTPRARGRVFTRRRFHGDARANDDRPTDERATFRRDWIVSRTLTAARNHSRR